jgi:hypothetical protein
MSMLSERVSAVMKSSAARVCAWCERVGHEDDRVLFLTIQRGHNGAPVTLVDATQHNARDKAKLADGSQ